MRAAAAVAELDGARVPLEALRRDTVERRAIGAGDPPLDPAWLVAHGAVRATVAAQAWTGTTGTAQLLAKLHVAAAQGLAPSEVLGRPAPGAATRLGEVSALVAVLSLSPAVVAAIAHAEITTFDLCAPSSRVVGFALARALVQVGGLDPLGVGVPELQAVADPTGYHSALEGYAENPLRFCVWWIDALTAGARFGALAADAVSAQRF